MQGSPFDEEASNNLFNNIMKMWVNPELDRRLNEERIHARDISRCLILLPNGQKPIVQFNEEGRLDAVARIALKNFEYGSIMYLHDIVEILHIRPPKLDRKRVAFVYMILVDMQWYVFFDFSPDHSDYATERDDKNWSMGKDIAKAENLRLQERIIKGYAEQMKQLERIGLWSVPSLFPYPMSLILHKLSENDEKGALAALISHCNLKYLESLTSTWFNIEPFLRRKRLIENALFSHTNGKWDLCIHTLMPHVEGIMSEWLESGPLKQKGLPKHQKDIAQKFSDIAKANKGNFTYKHLAESSTNFIMGPVLTKIEKWKKLYGPVFPNRHVVGHGAYDETLYSEENSIKVILLLDTIYYLIKQNTHH